ncbi:EpsG family protein [Treponema medium]|uniref:EpsG family protein n=1 Tax=Treponema medium TaxID=58231 RepID=UPI00197EBB00|nr:EpsG family protein [Treponema medium]QSH91300.1 EpsG family protein [Treponema medium]
MVFPYFIPPALAFVAAVVEEGMNRNVKRNIYRLILLSAIVIYCCVYLNGSDWPNYEMFFEKVTWHNWLEESKEVGFELGFSLCLLWLKVIGCNFMITLIIMKVFSLIIISHCFYKFSLSKYAYGDARNIFLLLFIFYTTNGMYLYVETIIRFSIALAIVIKSFNYLMARKFIPFLLLVLFASVFHRTSLVVVPLYFIRDIKLSSLWLFVLVVVVYVFFTPQMLLMIFKFMDGYGNNIFITKLIAYLELTIRLQQTNPLAIGNIVHFLFFILVLMFRKKIEHISQYGKQFFAATMIFFIVYFLTLYMGPISRIRLFYNFFFIIVLAELFSLTYINRGIVFIMTAAFCVWGMYLSIENNFCFKHYTNYITATIEGKADLTLYEKFSIYQSWSIDQ